MNPDYPFVKPHRHPNCVMLVVYLRGAPCRRERRAFFARMHAEARRLGVVLSHKLGVCLLFGAERICTTAHRHQMTTWLMDQPEVSHIDVGPLAHLANLFLPNARVAGRAGPLTAEARDAARALVRRVATGAVAQWSRYLTGELA
jgi:hypothetical protein